MTDSKPKNYSFAKVLPWLLTIGGIIGIICSLVLTYDQIQIWKTPNYRPDCNLNPIVSCGSVINSGQGDVLGIPAPFFGLIAFGVLTTVGVALLSGAKFKRWFWIGLEIGAIGGVASAFWLFLLSMYKVHALCPFCLSVDVVVYTLFWYISLHNLQAGHIKLPARCKGLQAFLVRHHLDILLLWFLILFVWIMHHFWYFYGKYF